MTAKHLIEFCRLMKARSRLIREPAWLAMLAMLLSPGIVGCVSYQPKEAGTHDCLIRYEPGVSVTWTNTRGGCEGDFHMPPLGHLRYYMLLAGLGPDWKHQGIPAGMVYTSPVELTCSITFGGQEDIRGTFEADVIVLVPRDGGWVERTVQLRREVSLPATRPATQEAADGK